MIPKKSLPIFLLVFIINEGISAIKFENSTNFYEDLKWPQKTVVYDISSEFTEPQRTVIGRAFLDIQKATCIRFKRRIDEVSYVKFKVSFVNKS